jgi:hypothetical protein
VGRRRAVIQKGRQGGNIKEHRKILYFHNLFFLKGIDLALDWS